MKPSITHTPQISPPMPTTIMAPPLTIHIGMSEMKISFQEQTAE